MKNLLLIKKQWCLKRTIVLTKINFKNYLYYRKNIL